MSSKQSEAIKRFWTAARLAGELPADEQPDDESWGDLTAEPREVDYIEADAAGLPAMWATPKRGAEDRVLLCMHGGGFLAGSIYSHRKMFGHLDKVRAFLDDSPGGDKPVWITELGWQSENVGEEQQAANLPRAYTVAMSRGVPRFNWYNFRDHSNKTFGLIQRNSGDEDSYAPKPSYVAYGVLTAQLAGLRHGHAEDAGDVHGSISSITVG